jgi:hypothetical protein
MHFARWFVAVKSEIVGEIAAEVSAFSAAFS